MADYLHLVPFFSWIPLALLAASQNEELCRVVVAFTLPFRAKVQQA